MKTLVKKVFQSRWYTRDKGIIVIIMYITVMFLFFNKTTPAQNIAYTQYKSSEYGFSIQYPKSWEMRDDFTNGTVLMAQEPRIDNSSNWQNINIVLTKDINMSTDNLIEKFNKEVLVSSLTNVYSGVNVESESVITINTVRGKKFVLSCTLNEKRIKGTICLLIKNNNLYTITYTCYEQNYEKNKSTIFYMLDTFKFHK